MPVGAAQMCTMWHCTDVERTIHWSMADLSTAASCWSIQESLTLPSPQQPSAVSSQGWGGLVSHFRPHAHDMVTVDPAQAAPAAVKSRVQQSALFRRHGHDPSPPPPLALTIFLSSLPRWSWALGEGLGHRCLLYGWTLHRRSLTAWPVVTVCVKGCPWHKEMSLMRSGLTPVECMSIQILRAVWHCQFSKTVDLLLGLGAPLVFPF